MSFLSREQENGKRTTDPASGETDDGSTGHHDKKCCYSNDTPNFEKTGEKEHQPSPSSVLIFDGPEQNGENNGTSLIQEIESCTQDKGPSFTEFNPYKSKKKITQNPSEIESVDQFNEEYNRIKWSFTGFVSVKEDITHFANQNGPGKRFAVIIDDNKGKTIKGVFFNKAADAFHGMIVEQHVYTFANATVKKANPVYNKCDAQFELWFSCQSKIEEHEGPLSLGMAITETPGLPLKYRIGDLSIDLNSNTTTWEIHARIIRKTEKKEFQHRNGGTGKRFAVDLLDESGVDIRGAFWDDVADHFYDNLEIGKMYSFSHCKLKQSNHQYNNCASKFEITFDMESKIACLTASTGIDLEQMNFIPLGTIMGMTEDSKVDIIAIVKEIEDPVEIYTVRGETVMKCDLQLVDSSCSESVKMTLWGKAAEDAMDQFQNYPVVAFCPVRIKRFRDVNYLAPVGEIISSPDHPLAHELTEWKKGKNEREETE